MTFDPLKEYSSGLVGCRYDPEAAKKFSRLIRDQGGSPFASQACRAYGLEGSGEGKLTALFKIVMDVFPESLPASAQTRGDCFVGGTLVRMGDGTEKPIESIEPGELVASPFGGAKRVLSTFAKPHDGQVTTLRAEGCVDAITATADHRFVSHQNTYEWMWRPAGMLQEGDRVFTPCPSLADELRYKTIDFAMEEECAEDLNAIARTASAPRRKLASSGKVRTLNSRSDCNRFAELNGDVGWVVGLWLAEGSVNKSRSGLPKGLVWNLAGDELTLAIRIRKVLAKEFGVNAVIRTIPSKPSCLFVKAHSAPLARWMYKACGAGNTYSKRVPKAILTSPRAVRMSCLRGWLEGDGCFQGGPRHGRPQYRMCKASGVSVCRGLIRDMKYLAMSCGVRCSETIRKARKQSKVASELHFYGDSVAAVMPGRAHANAVATVSKRSCVWSVDGGFAPRIKTISRSRFAGPVYCIEVEADHAFIANGYAVHNCVSHSTRTAALGTLASEIAAGKPDEVTKLIEGPPEVVDEARRDGVLSSEGFYWWRGYDQDGWSCEDAATVAIEKGIWVRKNYPSIGVDLTRYSGETAGKWGSRRPPAEVEAIGKEHLIRTATRAQTFAELRDLLNNGYAVSSCGGESWSNRRDEFGAASRTREGWAHAISVLGADDRPEIKQKYGEPLIHFQNSWGPNWISGGRRVLGTNIDIPEGSFWSKWSDCKDRVFIAFSGVNGWPPQKLPDWTGGVF